MEEAEKEVNAWVELRNKNSYVVNWQFTTEDARIKLKRLYPTIKGKINFNGVVHNKNLSCPRRRATLYQNNPMPRSSH